MGDRGVGEHPLDVVLRQGHQVAERHRQRGQDEDHDHPFLAKRKERLRKDTQHHRERPHLRAHGQVARHGRGRALVGVGRPVVERDGGHLERDARRQEGQTHREPGREGRLAGDDRADPGRHVGDPGGPGQAPDIGQAEQEDGAGERPEQEVLDRALGGERIPLVVPGEEVARDHHEFQAHEQDDEIRGRGYQHRAAQREHEDRGELRDREPARLQVVGREQAGDRGDRDEDAVEECGQVVHLVHPAERGPGCLAGPENQEAHPDESRQDHAESEVPVPGLHDVGQDDEHCHGHGGREGGDQGEVGPGHGAGSSRQRPMDIATAGSTAARTALTGPVMRSSTRAG